MLRSNAPVLQETANRNIARHPAKLSNILEYSKDGIPFLDILIKCNNDNIWMDIYYKPTNTHRCLRFSSNYPNHCKKNILFTLARRICTIVESTEAKMKHLENLNLKI